MEAAKYYEYKEKLDGAKTKMIIGAVIGAIMGIYMGMQLDNAFVVISTAIMGAFIFAGVIYTWTILPIIALGPWGLLCKFGISMCLGWALGPIALIYYIIRVKQYEKYVTDDAQENENIR